jgi:putative phosphoribosyl transferase
MRNLQIIPINASLSLEAFLSIPKDSSCIVIFAHGSNSSRTSSRNQILSQILNSYSFSTLLFDLLTKEEQESDIRTEQIIEESPDATLNKFNIELLTERLDAVTQWVQNNNDTKNLKIGYFSASTGAAAALYAASSFRDVKAVVSQCGRTDLVNKKTLTELSCPCLFIVGGNDKSVIEINNKTINLLTNVKDLKLELVKGALCLFEVGKIEEVGDIATKWLNDRI